MVQDAEALRKDMPSVRWLEPFFLGNGGGLNEWEDVGGGGGGGAGSSAAFALTASGFFFTLGATPVVLDASAAGGLPNMYFSGTDASTFDMSSSGRARILRPGMYVIGCQIDTKTNANLTASVDAYLALQYPGSGGFSIEVPWAISSFHGGSERLLGTRFDFPATTTLTQDADVYLQRLHPISLTSHSTFPFEILPVFDANYTVDCAWKIAWLAVWGWRIGDALDAYHSD